MCVLSWLKPAFGSQVAANTWLAGHCFRPLHVLLELGLGQGFVLGLSSSVPIGTSLLTVQPTQLNVHHGVAALSQSNRMLSTVQGAPPTDRAVRESTRYFTVLRPPSRSTLNCS